MTERDRRRLYRYEQRMGFPTGRDRVSVAAFPASQETDDDERDGFDPREIGWGKRWLTIPRERDES